MNHRQFFDQQAEKWDTREKPEETKLKRVVRKASIKKGDTVLDVGTGILLPYLTETTGKAGYVVAPDISLEMLKSAKAKHTSENTTYVQATAERLPFSR